MCLKHEQESYWEEEREKTLKIISIGKLGKVYENLTEREPEQIEIDWVNEREKSLMYLQDKH